MSHEQIIASRYRITERIGEGGMGEVYRGVDLQTGEAVAIKLLKPDIVAANPNLIERFSREGEALRQLNHPNIVKMLAAVEENGRHYIVMQYVGGGSLRDLLDRQPRLPIDRVLSLGIELADALTRAHHLKIVHRDLKPENVLLDENGTPLLTDFGVARIGTRTRMTETGSVIGTYAYLSPEACMAENMDQRTDIWSFGVMLYEMLAGQLPFAADQPTAILLGIIQKPLPDVRQLRPDTPPALADLIEQMLQKDQENRVPSVRLVGAALEAVQQGSNTPLPVSHLREAASGSPRFATTTPTGAGSKAVSAAAADTMDDPIIITMPTPAPSTPGGTALPAVSPVSPLPANRRKKLFWALGGLIVILAVAALLAVLGGLVNDKKNTKQMPSIAKVDPVKPGEYMVLVAQLEPLQNVQQRDVGRFIVDGLKETLEQDVPFSTLRIRAYPQVITSDQAAQAAAEANGATVVVWGNYTPDLIELQVQIGVTTSFKYIQIDREMLNRTANVRVHMTDERRESIAHQVLSIVNVLFAADGNGYESTRMLAIMAEIQVTSAQVVSGGVSGYLQRGALAYFDDTAQAIKEYDAAIALQPSNPIPYTYRTAADVRQGLFDQAQRDIETSRRLGPPNWTMPLYSEAMYASINSDYKKSLEIFSQIIELRPDDWFAMNYRGALHYLLGEYDLAQADLDRAITLAPNVNFPYIMAMMVALHQGRLADLQQDIHTVVTEFPDPSFSNRLIQAIYGDKVPSVFGPLFDAAGNLLLGQYEAVIPSTEAALALDPQLVDMQLAQGVAYCNLKNYTAAEAAYARGIALAPDYIVLYALRAEVRVRQGDMPGALEDTKVVQQSSLSSVFAPLIQLGLKGEWSCEKFFSYDYSQRETPNAQ